MFKKYIDGESLEEIFRNSKFTNEMIESKSTPNTTSLVFLYGFIIFPLSGCQSEPSSEDYFDALDYPPTSKQASKKVAQVQQECP